MATGERDPERWIQRLEAVARRGRWSAIAPAMDAPEEVRVAFIRGFRDEAGHRREVDAFLLSRLLHVPPPAVGGELRGEVALWHAAADGDVRVPEGSGRLFPDSATLGIETWTEMELCGLHALSWMALLDERAGERLRSVLAWLLAEVQPDNGTNHPWGIHAMIWEWIEREDLEARMYAETLEHVCQVHLGRPDLLSAAILLDAAAWLRRRADTRSLRSGEARG